MFPIIFPCRIICAGSSGAGKSSLIGRILERRSTMISQKLNKIIYCSKYITSMPKPLMNDKIVTFHEGLPTEDEINQEDDKNVLFVIDDLADTAFSSEAVCNLFTQGRNRNLGVILITQNLFPQNKKSRTIALNASYYIIFKNLRDGSQLEYFARQVYNENPKAFARILNKYSSSPHDYLLCDFNHCTPDLFRFRSNILSDTPTVFVDDERIKQCNKLGQNPKTQTYTFEIQ
jgi:hypothetical protein